MAITTKAENQAFIEAKARFKNASTEELELSLQQADLFAQAQQQYIIASEQRTSQMLNVNAVLLLFCAGVVLQADQFFVRIGALSAFLTLIVSAFFMAISIRPGRAVHLPGSSAAWSGSNLDKGYHASLVQLLATVEARSVVNFGKAKRWAALSFVGMTLLLVSPIVGITFGVLNFVFAWSPEVAEMFRKVLANSLLGT